MQNSNSDDRKQPIQNSLSLGQEQVAVFIGHSLRSLYGEVLAADLPEHLEALVLELEAKYPP
ncbi:hypothetical protein [Microvirga sp. VF16]|uniref:hypothetical protein n=1 Tax=Microvirga sp. VF16 TaxID=2807101 RepID=UPI00193CC817|nr:hypothetical protein [Microvirga sp. VF16]QRM35119.1 hypothetical protein JO965_39665 [Microvirga sp. VF16]